MNHIIGLFVGLILGTACGAFAGALVMGGVNALIGKPGWAFDTRAKVIYLGLVAGAIWGLLPGAVIGQIVGLTRCGSLAGALIGGAVVAGVAVYIFATGGFEERFITVSALSSIPGGALAGALTAQCTSYLYGWFPW